MFDSSTLRHLLQDRRLSFVSQKTGITRQTLYNIRSDPEHKASEKTREKLTEYFQETSPND